MKGAGAAQVSGVASPCVDICRLDAEGLCVGCRRTLDEIAEWLAIYINRFTPDHSIILCKILELHTASTRRHQKTIHLMHHHAFFWVQGQHCYFGPWIQTESEEGTV